MADSRFFENKGPFSLGEIEKLSGAVLHGGADPKMMIHDVAPLDKAGSTHLSFLDNVKYKAQFRQTAAGACFIHEKMVDLALPGVALLISSSPYKSYALTAQKFYPEKPTVSGISPFAHIDETAFIGEGTIIEAGAVISAGVKIGRDCYIEANAVLCENVEIGDYCRIGPNASVSHTLMGNHVRVYPGVRIGQDGFGFAIDPSGHVKVPQLGRVIIEDGVQIGANTTIDRGAGPDTVIGAGTWIDNLVQIGHNVKIGRGCILVAQSGVSGSSVLEDFVVLGGQSGIAGHLRVGKGARIGGQSGVMRNVPAGEEHLGTPAMPIKKFMRHVATLNQLIKKDK